MNLIYVDGVLCMRTGELLRPVPQKELQLFKVLYELERKVKLDAGLREAAKRPPSLLAKGWTPIAPASGCSRHRHIG